MQFSSVSSFWCNCQTGAILQKQYPLHNSSALSSVIFWFLCFYIIPEIVLFFCFSSSWDIFSVHIIKRHIFPKFNASKCNVPVYWYVSPSTSYMFLPIHHSLVSTIALWQKYPVLSWLFFRNCHFFTFFRHGIHIRHFYRASAVRVNFIGFSWSVRSVDLKSGLDGCLVGFRACTCSVTVFWTVSFSLCFPFAAVLSFFLQQQNEI